MIKFYFIKTERAPLHGGKKWASLWRSGDERETERERRNGAEEPGEIK